MRAFYVFLAAALVFSLSSCSFLPQEEEPLPAPVARSYERQVYTMAVVARGDIVLTKGISAAYRPVMQESYGFAVNGVLVEGVYVSVGDTVKAGELLAELDRKDQLAAIKDAEIDLRKLLRTLEYERGDTSVSRDEYILKELLNELKALEELEDGANLMRRHDIKEKIREQEKILADTKDARATAVDFAEKQVLMAEQKLESLKKEAAERAIYAEVDGMITYVKSIPGNYLSIEKDSIITISDASETAYEVSASDAEYFTAGETYQLKIGDEVYEAVAEERENAAGVTALFLYPRDVGSDLASFGTVDIELERRDGALYLPTKAVKDSGGAKTVYYLDENGLRSAKTVETGISVGGRVEIVSGLSEGEEVIVG